ncbi:hypothetical protein V5O48_015870 [Marasmius crinis-equi]|uniref:BHLH domain-containing protein n=1 Tax=Marasmius crinis-equi TaxID=585013 RepID=A0ABR3ETD5_9AGAR
MVDKGSYSSQHEESFRLIAEEGNYRQGTADFITSYFPMPQPIVSGDPQTDSPASSSATTTIGIDIDPLSAALSSMSASGGPGDPGGSVSPLSPVSAITMSALDLNQSNSSSGRDQNVNMNAGGSGGQAQEGVGQGMFSMYGNNGRSKNGSSGMLPGLGGLGGLGGGLGAAALGSQLLGMNMDALQSSPSSGGGGAGSSDGQGSPGNVTQQIMLEQFRLAQLQQLQQLQAQIFQQQLALINSGAMASGVNSGSESSATGEQSQNNASQARQSGSFHGLPTPGSSAELRATAPPVEFVSPMLLNYVTGDLNNMSNSGHHHQNHASFDPATSSPHPQSASSSAHEGHRHSHSHHHSHHSHSHSQSNPHSLTQTPVFGAQQDDNATNMMLDSLAPLTNRFGTTQENDNNTFQHRGTSSAPAHIAFSRPHTQNESDFDISPLTSPWLGAQGAQGGRSRVHAYNHHHPHVHQHQHPSSSQTDWNSASTKRTGSPMEDQARKLRQSPAIRATIPSEFSSMSTSSAGRRNSRSSRSVTSTPLLKGSTGMGRDKGSRSRRDSLATPRTSPPSAGGSSGGNSASGNVSHANGGLGEMIQDSPSPVDLSLAMAPPATPNNSDPSADQGSASHSSAASSSNTSMFGVGLESMFDVGSFNFGSLGAAQTPSNAGRGYSSESMPPPLMPVTPASIMNLGRGMGGMAGSVGTSSGGNNVLSGFPSSGDGMGQGSGAGVSMDMPMLPPSSAPTSPIVDPAGSYAAGNGSAGTSTAGRKGKSKATKDTTATPANGVSTRSKSARKTAVTPSPNLKAILPASTSSNSPSIVTSSSSPTITNPPSSSTSTFPTTAVRKTSHKAAEQKRRDSLKTTFDDLRGLLPPIPLPSDATDDLGGGGGFVAGVVAAARASMLPGALPPRGPPKAGGEGPNKGVSKLQLLICGNEYIRVLKARVERRDDEIEKLRREVSRMRLAQGGGGMDVNEEMDEEEPVDLEKDLDAVEWAHVRAQSGINTEPILEEDEGEEG